MGYWQALFLRFYREMKVCRVKNGLAAGVLTALLAGCSDAPSSALPELREVFKPGYSLDDSMQTLKNRKATLSVYSAAECESLFRASSMPAQLRPAGGPCVLAKIPISNNILGGHTDVIVQLVFDRQDKLADGNFEEIAIPFGWSGPPPKGKQG